MVCMQQLQHALLLKNKSQHWTGMDNYLIFLPSILPILSQGVK